LASLNTGPQLAAQEGQHQAGADGGHQGHGQQQQPVRRHRLGRHARRIDQRKSATPEATSSSPDITADCRRDTRSS
jgi:hypothetical protein